MMSSARKIPVRGDARRVSAMALVGALTLAALLLANPPPAAAQTPTPAPYGLGGCMKAASGQTSCSASDMRFGTFTAVIIDGCTDTTADTYTAVITAEMQANSSSIYDPSIWINRAGGSALTAPNADACFRQVLHTASAAGPWNLLSGSGAFKELEGNKTDSCGDTVQGELNRIILNGGQPLVLPCRDADNNGAADFSACLSWDQNAGSTCNGYLTALPGAPSKCTCTPDGQAINVPITVIDVTIAKSCTPNVLPYDSPNRTIACTITYKNNSTIVATNFQLLDDYDQTRGSVSQISSGGVLSTPLDTITWKLPTIAAGASGSVTYNYTLNDNLPQGTTVLNTASLWYRTDASAAFTEQDIATTESILLGSPLAVDLAAFTAGATWGGVTLAWETVSEADNAGFNVYRSQGSDDFSRPSDPWRKLNAALIPAAAPGSSGGHTYAWVDATVKPNTSYVYRLEAVALDGTTEFLEAVGVTYRPAWRRWLPVAR